MKDEKAGKNGHPKAEIARERILNDSHNMLKLSFITFS
jgi:hypothetical protein